MSALLTYSSYALSMRSRLVAAAMLLHPGVTVQGQERAGLLGSLGARRSARDRQGQETARTSQACRRRLSASSRTAGHRHVRLCTDTDTPSDRRPAHRQQLRACIPNRQSGDCRRSGIRGSQHPHDEIFALAFNEDVSPALSPSAPFTSDSAVLRAALEAQRHRPGRTALYDAISTGVDYLRVAPASARCSSC